MASSSSGDGPSTSGGGARCERPRYWGFVPVVVVRNTYGSHVAPRKLLVAELDVVRPREFAKKLRRMMGAGLDAAAAALANPKSNMPAEEECSCYATDADDDYLLSDGANVDPVCPDGKSPEHVSARKGQGKMLELLPRDSTHGNILLDDLHTPLVASRFGSSLECLQTFIEAGADVDIDSSVTPLSPLSLAACKNLADCIKCLLNKDADPNELGEDGKLPLEIAASKGWLECGGILLPKTNPLQKYANLSIDQIVQQETTARFLRECWAIAGGDFALEKEYDRALKCYPLALKLGHTEPVSYAKRSLCHQYNCDEQSCLPKSSICHMALCCGMFWVMMKLGFGDSIATLLCANDCSVTEILRLFSSDALNGCATFLCGLPITDKNMVGCSAQLQVRLMDVIKDMEVSNKATICLDESDDGTEHKSLKAVQSGIGAIRAWCLKYGLHFDVSRIYGPNLMVYTTPAGGTFYVTIEYLGRSLTLLLAGRNPYIKGWRGPHGAFEMAQGSKTQYMLGDVTMITLEENYRFLSPDTLVGETWVGAGAWRDSFEVLYKFQGKMYTGLNRAIGRLAVGIAEAARIQCVYKAQCSSFLNYFPAKLDDLPGNSFWIRDYGYYCRMSMGDTEHRLATDPPGIVNRENANVKSSFEVFREIRIILRDACTEAAKEERPPMVEDPDDYHNKLRFSISKGPKSGTKRTLKQERRVQSKKPRWDEFSLGGGDGKSPRFAYLLEDWFPEVDPAVSEIKGNDKNKMRSNKNVIDKAFTHEKEAARGPPACPQQHSSSRRSYMTMPLASPFPPPVLDDWRDYVQRSGRVRDFLSSCRGYNGVACGTVKQPGAHLSRTTFTKLSYKIYGQFKTPLMLRSSAVSAVRQQRRQIVMQTTLATQGLRTGFVTLRCESILTRKATIQVQNASALLSRILRLVRR